MFSSLQIHYSQVTYSSLNLENRQLWAPKIWLQSALTLVIEHTACRRKIHKTNNSF